MRHLLIAVCIAVFGVGAASAQIVEREGNPDIIFSTNDPDMDAAGARARKTLGYFFEKQDEIGDYFGDFSVKIGMPANGGDREFIWVVNPRIVADGMTGFLNNEPYDQKGDFQIGDKVHFSRDQIIDWAFLDGDKYRGHFTTRILIQSYPQETIDAFMAEFHDEPVPTEAER